MQVLIKMEFLSMNEPESTYSFPYYPNKIKPYIRYPFIIAVFFILNLDSEGRQHFISAITLKEFNKHSLVILMSIYFVYVTTIELLKFQLITINDFKITVPSFRLIFFEENLNLNNVREIREIRSDLLSGITIITNSNQHVFVKKNFMNDDQFEHFKQVIQELTNKKVNIVFDARSRKK